MRSQTLGGERENLAGTLESSCTKPHLFRVVLVSVRYQGDVAEPQPADGAVLTSAPSLAMLSFGLASASSTQPPGLPCPTFVGLHTAEDPSNDARERGQGVGNG